MILVNPVFYALNHKLTHHRLLRCSLVTAATAVAVLTIGCFAIEIVGIGALEVGVLDVVGVVIHHVEDNTDTSLMQGLNHLLELVDSNLGLIGIGRIASLRHIVVHGIVTPVVLVIAQSGLIYRTVIVAGQDMDGVYT